MNDKLYRIKPLEWEKCTNTKPPLYSAHTPFGSYTIDKIDDGSGYRLYYCFDEYYDEGSYDLKTVQECKKKAIEDWFNRIKRALEEVK